jgi:hypothetical protein
MIVVADDHVVEIRADRSGGARSMIVSVELDHRQSWLFDEPGWQELAVGVAGGVAYWWSARHLVLLPTGQRTGDPVVISADEDIRLAFAVADDWLLVCETSARLVRSDNHEVSRLEFGEVVLAARREGPALVLRDASDQEIKVVVHEGRLAIAG